MFRMTPHGHRLSNGGLTDSHLPLDVPGGSLDLGYLPRDPPGTYPHTRVNCQLRWVAVWPKTQMLVLAYTLSLLIVSLWSACKVNRTGRGASHHPPARH